MTKISDSELESFKKVNSSWEVVEGSLQKTFPFPDFKTGIKFVNEIALLAEEDNHHPDLKINYSSVTVSLLSHDENGITDKDINLAEKIERIAEKG